MAIEIGDLHALRRDDGDIAIGEEKNLARMMKQRGNIAGDKIFIFAKAHDRRRTEPRGDDFVGLTRRENGERVNAREALDGLADSIFERLILEIFLDEMRDNFGIGFSDELVAFAHQFVLQLEIILDDAVVHHDDFPGAIAMRMRIFFSGAAVRGPARVADAIDPIYGVFAEHFLEIAQLSGCTANFELAIVVHNGDPRGIIAAIFEAAQAVQNQRNNFFRSDITNNSAHSEFLPKI